MEDFCKTNRDDDDLGEPISVPATLPFAAKTEKKFSTNNSTEFQSPTNKTTESLAGVVRRYMSQGRSTSNSRGGADVSNITIGAPRNVIVPGQSLCINPPSTSKQQLALHPFHRVDVTNTTAATLATGTNAPHSWLAARLIRGGMSHALALDCGQKLVHIEGFSNVRDLAESPPSMFHHAYLTRVGIVGLGTQQQVLRLHSELQAQYNQKLQQQQQESQSTNVATAEVAIVTTTSSTTCAAIARTSTFPSSNKRAWSENQDMRDSTLAHAYVPAPPNKRLHN